MYEYLGNHLFFALGEEKSLKLLFEREPIDLTLAAEPMAFVYEIVVRDVSGDVKMPCFSDKFGYILTKQIIFTDSSKSTDGARSSPVLSRINKSLKSSRSSLAKRTYAIPKAL